MLGVSHMALTLNLLYRRYRLIALAVYGAVLLAGLIDWVYGGIGPRAIVDAPKNYRFLLFAIAVLTLIILEQWTVGSRLSADWPESRCLRSLTGGGSR